MNIHVYNYYALAEDIRYADLKPYNYSPKTTKLSLATHHKENLVFVQTPAVSVDAHGNLDARSRAQHPT
jgi:hypothetical protein